MDKNTLFYLNSAKRYGLDVEPIEEIGGFILRLGKHHYFFRKRDTPFNTLSSATAAKNKVCTNIVLSRHNIPVPKMFSFSREEMGKASVLEWVKTLRFPVVVKPHDSGGGRDVVCNIDSLEYLLQVMHDKFKYYEFLIVEEYYANLNSYRVLVHEDKILGITIRYPSQIIGDGLRTIEELIEATNFERQRMNEVLKPIQIDEECSYLLKQQGLELSTVIEKNVKIELGYTCNSSRGGTFYTVDPKTMCAENKELMIEVARVMNLGLTGIDVECKDIGLPLVSTGGVIIEVNHAPSIRIHEDPMDGKVNPVTRQLMKHLIKRHKLAYLVRLFNYKATALYARILLVTSLVFCGSLIFFTMR